MPSLDNTWDIEA